MIPDEISKIVRLVPFRSHRKGEVKTPKKGNSYTTKTGVWVFKTKSKSIELIDHIDEFILNVNFNRNSLMTLPGVEEVYIDVFLAKDFSDDEDSEVAFEFKPSQLQKLSEIGLPIRFAISTGRE